MAKYAIDLLTNKAKHALFAKAGRKRAEELFNETTIVDEYEKYYEEILNQPPIE